MTKLIISITVFIITMGSIYFPQKADSLPGAKIRTSGTFICPTCTNSQEWYIDENHILYWEDKPYIPHAVTGFEPHLDTVEGGGKGTTRKKIDNFMNKGITDFIIMYNGQIENLRRNLAASAEINANNNWYDDTTDYITSRGGTYIFQYQPHTEPPEDVHIDTAYFEHDEVRSLIVAEFIRLRPLVSKEGLRALVLFGEINVMGILPPQDDGGFEDFSEILNYYAKEMKEKIGNVPLTLRIAYHYKFLPYLYSMSGEYIDGAHPEYSGSTPNDVEQLMSGSPYLRYFNSFKKTKVMWPNLEVWIGPHFPPYISEEVMWETFKIAASQGATGILLDIGAPVPEVWYKEGRERNVRWYGALKNPFADLVLKNAESKMFVKGRYAPTLDNVGFKFKDPKLTEDQVISIALSDEDVANLMRLYPCLSIHGSFFDDSSGVWEVAILVSEVEEEIGYTVDIDDQTGKIIRNTVNLERQAKALGYTHATEKDLKEHIDLHGCK
jgi:hypothetical protein